MKYSITSNSMRLSGVEVICSFSGSLFVYITYSIPKKNIDTYIDRFLGTTHPCGTGSKSKNSSFIMLSQGQKGATIMLYPETSKERKALSGPGFIQGASYIGTQVIFVPMLTEKQFEKGYKAISVK